MEWFQKHVRFREVKNGFQRLGIYIFKFSKTGKPPHSFLLCSLKRHMVLFYTISDINGFVMTPNIIIKKKC